MKIAIYGIGNILMGDDGVGLTFVRHLASKDLLPPDVTLEDLGTPSLDLPAYLAGYDRVIFIDAVAAAAPPGTIRLYTRDEITSVPTGIRVSPHEPTIDDAPHRPRLCRHGAAGGGAGGGGAGDAVGRDDVVAAGGGGGCRSGVGRATCAGPTCPHPNPRQAFSLTAATS